MDEDDFIDGEFAHIESLLKEYQIEDGLPHLPDNFDPEA